MTLKQIKRANEIFVELLAECSEPGLFDGLTPLDYTRALRERMSGDYSDFTRNCFVIAHGSDAEAKALAEACREVAA